MFTEYLKNSIPYFPPASTDPVALRIIQLEDFCVPSKESEGLLPKFKSLTPASIAGLNRDLMYYNTANDKSNTLNGSFQKYFQDVRKSAPQLGGDVVFNTKTQAINLASIAKLSLYLCFAPAFKVTFPKVDPCFGNSTLVSGLDNFISYEGKLPNLGHVKHFDFKPKDHSGHYLAAVGQTIAGLVLFGINPNLNLLKLTEYLTPVTDLGLIVDVQTTWELAQYLQYPIQASTSTEVQLPAKHASSSGSGKNPFGIVDVSGSDQLHVQGISLQSQTEVDAWLDAYKHISNNSLQVSLLPEPTKSRLYLFPTNNCLWSDIVQLIEQIKADSKTYTHTIYPVNACPAVIAQEVGSTSPKVITTLCVPSLPLGYLVALQEWFETTHWDTLIKQFTNLSYRGDLNFEKTNRLHKLNSTVLTQLYSLQYVDLSGLAQMTHNAFSLARTSALLPSNKSGFPELGIQQKLSQLLKAFLGANFLIEAQLNGLLTPRATRFLNSYYNDIFIPDSTFSELHYYKLMTTHATTTLSPYLSSDILELLTENQISRITALVKAVIAGYPNTTQATYLVKGIVIGTLLKNLEYYITSNSTRRFSVTAGRTLTALRGEAIISVVKEGNSLLKNLGLIPQGNTEILANRFLTESKNHSFNDGLSLSLNAGKVKDPTAQ